MSDFKIKMLQIRLRLWLRPRPKALPRPIAELRGLLLRGREGETRERRIGERGGKVGAGGEVKS